MKPAAGWRGAALALGMVASLPVAWADPEADYAAARAALQAGEYAAAADIFEPLAAAHPDNADYLLGHGQALLALARAEAALVPLRRARALAPDYLDVLQVLGSACLAAGRRDEAREVYHAAAALAPEAAWVARGLAASAAAAPGARVARSMTAAAGPGLAAGAPPAAAGTTTWVLGFEATLTERNDTWHEQGVGVDHAWSQRARLGLRVARSERFGADDTLIEVNGSLPLGERWTLAARGVLSPTHRVRVEEGGVLDLSVVLPHGFVLSAGGGRMEYDSGPSDLVTTTLEHYVGDYRLAYTAILVQPVRGEWTPAHRWAGGWYYGSESYLNLSLAWGEETDETVLGEPTTFDSWGAGINGRHWLNRHFAFDYAGGYNGLESERGDHLDRTTFYLGVALRY